MNYRLYMVGLCSLLLATAAGAQSIPSTIKNAPDASGDRAAIDRVVKSLVGRLAGRPGDTQKLGRDGLEREAGSAAGTTPSYRDVYAASVNANLLPLASNKGTPLPTRLNAAIANSGVAAKTGSVEQAPVTLQFINDSSEPVALWGLKAARHVLPAVLQAPGGAGAGPNRQFLPAISAAVKRHANSGPVAEEAYNALQMNVVQGGNVDNGAVKAVIPEMLNVLRLRVGQFQKGIPQQPAADVQATTFLTHARVWQQMTPAQQKDTVQLMAHLLDAAGQHLQPLSPNAVGRNELVELVRLVGAALQLVGDAIKDANVTDTAKALLSVSRGTDGDTIRQRTDAVFPAVKRNARFKDLKPLGEVKASDDVEEEIVEEDEPVDEEPAGPANDAPRRGDPAGGGGGAAGGAGGAPGDVLPGGGDGSGAGTPPDDAGGGEGRERAPDRRGGGTRGGNRRGGR